jgi:DME family drug/metabolite transporter
MAELSTAPHDLAHRGTSSAASAVLVLAGAALFGTVGTAQALGPDVPSESLAAARMLLAAVLLGAVAAVSGRRRGVRVALRQAPAWWAGLGQASFNLCFLAAMKQAGVAVGTLVAIGATPVVTGLVTRHVTRRWALATTVAVAGLALLVLGERGTTSAPSVAGVLLALGAAASYAAYIIAGNAAAARGLETRSFLAAAFAVAALLTLPWLVTGDVRWAGTTGGALVLGYLVLIPTIVSYNLFNRGLHGVRASTAATLGLVEPVVAATLAYVVLGERLAALGFLGAATVVVGLLLIIRSTATVRQGDGVGDVPLAAGRPVGGRIGRCLTTRRPSNQPSAAASPPSSAGPTSASRR